MLTSNLEKATTRELLTLYARVLEHLRERDVRSSNNPLSASVVTPKPANGGQGKTGQRKWPGTRLFYPAASCGGKSIFVRQLRGPHLST